MEREPRRKFELIKAKSEQMFENEDFLDRSF